MLTTLEKSTGNISSFDEAIKILSDDDSGDQKKPIVVQVDGKWYIDYGEQYLISEALFRELMNENCLVHRAEKTFVPTVHCKAMAAHVPR